MFAADHRPAFGQAAEIMSRHGRLAEIGEMVMDEFKDIENKTVAEIYIIHLDFPRLLCRIIYHLLKNNVFFCGCQYGIIGTDTNGGIAMHARH